MKRGALDTQNTGGDILLLPLSRINLVKKKKRRRNIKSKPPGFVGERYVIETKISTI